MSCADDDLPYVCVTGRDLRLDFSMETIPTADAADSAATPEDLSDVTGVQVAVRRQGLPEETRAWSWATGEVTVEANLIRLNVDKAVTALMTPGRWQAQLNLTRSGGVDECALRFELAVREGVG